MNLVPEQPPLADRFVLHKILQRKRDFITYEAKDLKTGLHSIVKLCRISQHLLEIYGDETILSAQQTLQVFRHKLEANKNIWVQEIASSGPHILFYRPFFRDTLRGCIRHLSIDEKKWLAHQLIALVHTLHTRGITHGGLSVSNVFLDCSARLILTDFNILSATKLEVPSSLDHFEEDMKNLGAILYFIFSGHQYSPEFDAFNIDTRNVADLKPEEFQVIVDMLSPSSTATPLERLNRGLFTFDVEPLYKTIPAKATFSNSPARRPSQGPHDVDKDSEGVRCNDEPRQYPLLYLNNITSQRSRQSLLCLLREISHTVAIHPDESAKMNFLLLVLEALEQKTVVVPQTTGAFLRSLHSGVADASDRFWTLLVKKYSSEFKNRHEDYASLLHFVPMDRHYPIPIMPESVWDFLKLGMVGGLDDLVECFMKAKSAPELR